MKIVSLITLCVLCGFSGDLIEAKKYNKCSVLRELKRHKVPNNELADWVCIAQYESSYDTKVTNWNTDKSKDWGIFQINDRYWCNPQDGRRTKNICKMSCKDVAADNIGKAIKCAQIIKRQHKGGFSAWVAWNKHCQKSKPDISKC